MDEEILKIANEAKTEAHHAKHIAYQANNRIESYISVNTVQYENMVKEVTKLEHSFNGKMDELRDAIKSLVNRAWYVAGTVILILLGAFGSAIAIILQHMKDVN